MNLVKLTNIVVSPWRRKVTAIVTGIGLLVASQSGQAGDGSINTANQTIDLSVLFSYHETDAKLNDAASNPSWHQVFDDASKRLWNATNGQLTIGKVKVYRRAFNKKDSADIWILKNAGGAYANGIAKLGVAGNRMTFYEKTHRSTNAAYQGGYSIVHEMGHYVFGCYDQYLGASVPVAKKTTFTNADLSAYTKNAFIYSITENDPNASIMDGGGGVNNTRTEFDTAANTVPGKQDGTKWWMNKQWIVNKESCWETMGKFKWGGVNVFPTVPAGASDTALPVGATDVTWEVIPTLSRLVLCIDRSGSMDLENRMNLAILGARIFTSLTEERHEFTLFAGTASEEAVVFEGDFLGVVDFDDATTTTYPITEVDVAGTVKSAAKAAINGLYARGSTAIGDGAQRSLDLITGLGATVTQEAIILLSDGQNNSGSNPATAAANAAARGAKIYTIALGAGADASTLASMAAATGGKFYAATDGLALVDIYTRIYGELRGGGLVEAIADLSFEATETLKTVNVDPYTEEVTFAVASPDPGFAMEVISPSNVTYTGSVPADGVVYENEGSELHYRISDPESGKWKIKITSPNTSTGTTYQYSFVSNSSNSKVSVTAYTGETTYAYPEPALLRCQVTAGDPVTGASVTADVSGPDGVLGTVTLFDDGLPVHGDEAAGDSVYSAYYSAFPSSGTYSFTVRVVNTKGTVGIANPEDGPDSNQGKPVPPFSRETTTNVAVTGVPAVDRQWMRVNALSFTNNAKPANTAKFKASCTFNSPTGLFTPLLDDLVFRLNGSAVVVVPAAIFKQKKPGTFSFQDKVNGISGSLKTFVGGSSRSELIISSSKAFSGGFFFGSPTTATVQFGTLNETVSLKTDVKETKGVPSGITYNARKNFLNSSQLYVDGLKGSVNHQQIEKDSFRIVATLEGALGYDPAVNSLIISLGGFNITVPPNTLVLDAKKLKGKATLAVGSGKVNVAIDLASGIVSIKGSKLNIGQNLGASTVVGFSLGFFNQSNLLVLIEKLKKGASDFTF
jgi:hypothetical protein